MTELDLPTLRALSEPETAAWLDALPDVDEARGLLALQETSAATLAAMPQAPMPEGVTLTVEDDGTRVFTPEGAATDRCLLWVHGGGLVAGDPRSTDDLNAGFALEQRVVVRAVRYRLAPQHPFPAGLEDCLAGHVRAHELFGSVLLVGASAGGNLVLATALAARERGLPAPRGVVACYPMLDDRPGSPSMERATARQTWHRAINRLAWDAYLAQVDEVPYLAAPGRATVEELRGLPPVALDVGSLDGFRDEVLAFAADLARADVPVDLCVTPRAWHASERLAPDAPSSQRIWAFRRAAIARMLA